MHKESDEDTVIVSPSMNTGVSFDDDTARFQIIAKVPYPSLASQKNKLRQRIIQSGILGKHPLYYNNLVEE